MARTLGQILMSALPTLRHQPTRKHIRAKLGERTVVDSRRAVLLWEPRRVVSTWAVPADDILGELRPVGPSDHAADSVGLPMPELSDRPILDPSIPFAVHTAEGEVVDLVLDGDVLPAAGLRLAEEGLEGYVVLDFDAFDSWWEEDVQNVGHPREPFHRIDCLPSSRHVRLELGGVPLAESRRPVLLFETGLPMRFYLPRDEVLVPMESSSTRTTCAYKGHATYHSPVVNGQPVKDLAWSYESPLPEAAAVRGLVAFFDERVDVTLDGEPRHRPVTPWS